MQSEPGGTQQVVRRPINKRFPALPLGVGVEARTATKDTEDQNGGNSGFSKEEEKWEQWITYQSGAAAGKLHGFHSIFLYTTV